MSRAVVTILGSGRPLALVKSVALRPSARPFCRHARGEGGLGAGERLRHDDGHVVRRANAERQDRIAHAYRLAGLQPELRRRLARGAGGDRERVVHRKAPVADRLEEEVERHHLGERGGMARGLGVLFVEDMATRRFDNHAGIARIAAPALPPRRAWGLRARATMAARRTDTRRAGGGGRKGGGGGATGDP